MPPHCDTLDGPVVLAARQAIADINLLPILPWIPEEAEEEVRHAFELTMHVREKSPDARVLADRFFFETVVRCHRLGEGAPYTGLKPAGLKKDPAIALAEEAITNDNREELTKFLVTALGYELGKRHDFVRSTATFDPCDIPAARTHVQAKLSFLHFVDTLYRFLREDRQEPCAEKHETSSREAHERHAIESTLGSSYAKRHKETAKALLHPG